MKRHPITKDIKKSQVKTGRKDRDTNWAGPKSMMWQFRIGRYVLAVKVPPEE